MYLFRLKLWKKLYLREFGRPRLRGLRGFVDRDDGREIKPLPSRANPEDIKDWKWMFRISLNWKNGPYTLLSYNRSIQTRYSNRLIEQDDVLCNG